MKLYSSDTECNNTQGYAVYWIKNKKTLNVVLHIEVNILTWNNFLCCSGNIPKVPNSAMCTIFWTKFGPNNTISSSIRHSLFPLFTNYSINSVHGNNFLMDLDPCIFFNYCFCEAGWLVTLLISWKFHRAVFVNFYSIDSF